MKYVPTYKFLNIDKREKSKAPFRKVVGIIQVNGGYVEELECGHELFIREEWSGAKKRRCKNCEEGNNELSSVR
jgi:hypothetical protein